MIGKSSAGGGGSASYDDYIRWYKLDEVSGLVAVDEAGNFNGTINGGTLINQTGQVNKSYSFDGINDYVSLDDLGMTTFPITIKFWVKPPDVSGNKWIISNTDALTYAGFLLYLNDDTVKILYGDGGGLGVGARRIITSGSVLTANVWQQISMKFTDVSGAELKVNNVSKTMTYLSGGAASVDFNTTYDFCFRNTATDYSQLFLDEFTVWDRLLTNTEETDIYTLENAGNSMI